MSRNVYASAHAAPPQKPAKKSGGPWRVVFIISLIVLIGSLVALGLIAFSYYQGQQKYDEVAQLSDFDPEKAGGELRELTVDWDALLAANPDTVAWVYIPNTPINYPVVQGKDNDYYLYRDFDGDQGWLVENGAVFLDYRNDPKFKDPSTFIYGHHLNDGTMFAAIGEIGDQARFEDCRTVYLLTPDGNYKLRAYSLVHCAAADAIVRTTFDSEEDMTSYIQDIINRSEFNPGSIPAASDIKKSFAFSTCDSTWQSSGRYVLFCYIDSTTVDELSGNVGLSTGEQGETTGFSGTVTDVQPDAAQGGEAEAQPA